MKSKRRALMSGRLRTNGRAPQKKMGVTGTGSCQEGGEGAGSLGLALVYTAVCKRSSQSSSLAGPSLAPQPQGYFHICGYCSIVSKLICPLCFRAHV